MAFDTRGDRAPLSSEVMRLDSMNEKQCPYCAEKIKAVAIKCRFCGADLSSGDYDLPSISGQRPFREANPTVASCPACNVALVTTQVRRFVSLSGCLSAVLVIIGLICCLTIVGFVTGLIFMVLAIIVRAIGGKKTVMICPQCGQRGRTIS